MADKDALIGTLLDLAAALKDGQLDGQARRDIQALVEDNDLPDGDAVPDWVVQMLRLVMERKTTDGWVPFKLRGLDDSDVLDFLRQLHQVLPIDFEDHEESWLLGFSKLGVEAAISFEGPAYRLSRPGETWA